MACVTGDFKAAWALVSDLKKLDKSGSRRELNNAVAETSLKLIEEGFAYSRDPDGNAWEPLKFRSGKPLAHTGELANSFQKGSVGAHDFEIISDWEHIETHQDGKVINGPGVFPVYNGMAQKSVTSLSGRPMKYSSANSIAATRAARAFASGNVEWVGYNQVEVPARPMVPEDTQNADGFPPRWEQKYEQTIEKFLFRILKYD